MSACLMVLKRLPRNVGSSHSNMYAGFTFMPVDTGVASGKWPKRSSAMSSSKLDSASFTMNLNRLSDFAVSDALY